MKKTFIFSFLLLNILTFSQINRFYYELNYKPNKDSSKIEKLLTVLDIKDGKSLYLNQELAVHDSIITASNENPSKFELFDWKSHETHAIPHTSGGHHRCSGCRQCARSTHLLPDFRWQLRCLHRRLGLFNTGWHHFCQCAGGRNRYGSLFVHIHF